MTEDVWMVALHDGIRELEKMLGVKSGRTLEHAFTEIELVSSRIEPERLVDYTLAEKGFRTDLPISREDRSGSIVYKQVLPLAGIVEGVKSLLVSVRVMADEPIAKPTKSIGALIMERRMLKSWTPYTLGVEARLAESAVEDFEIGTRSPSPGARQRLALALGASVADFLAAPFACKAHGLACTCKNSVFFECGERN